MKLTINTSSYNERRHGKPYIAKMNFATAKGEPAWGEWVGQAGDAGMLILDCEAGDIVMRGQRDNRNMKNSAPDYFIVRDDMSLSACSKVEAYKAWQLKNEQGVTARAHALTQNAQTQTVGNTQNSGEYEMNEFIGTATYSPDDNKIRPTPVARTTPVEPPPRPYRAPSIDSEPQEIECEELSDMDVRISTRED